MKLYWIILSLFFPCIAYAGKVMISPADQPIIVRSSHPEFEIRLPSNPGSTGYIWFLKQYNQDIIEPVAMTYHKANSELIGASGVSAWKFKVNSRAFAVPQSMTVSFIQQRQGQVGLTRKANFSIMTFPEKHYTSRIREFMKSLFSSHE
jgi:predicted secreted protein